jgi:hypothetical protein
MLVLRQQQQDGAFPASCCQLHAALLLQQWAQQSCQQCEHLAGLLHAEHLLLQQLLNVQSLQLSSSALWALNRLRCLSSQLALTQLGA